MRLELIRSSATIIDISKTFSPVRILFQIVLLFSITSMVLVTNLDDYEIVNDDDIINLPTSKFPEPDCTYRVRFSNRTGSELKRKVGIGEPVYHHWTCSYKQHQNGLFCIVVNNCTISNPRPGSLPVPIIDELGCSLFPTIMPHIEYNGDLEGGLQTNIFLLDIDQMSVTFHCNIKLLLKLHGICRRQLCPSI